MEEPLGRNSKESSAERSRDLDVRDRAIAALEADLAQRSARVRELDSTSVRRTALLDAQEAALGQMQAALETKEREVDERLRQAADTLAAAQKAASVRG